jgi:hypothetical protein
MSQTVTRTETRTHLLFTSAFFQLHSIHELTRVLPFPRSLIYPGSAQQRVTLHSSFQFSNFLKGERMNQSQKQGLTFWQHLWTAKITRILGTFVILLVLLCLSPISQPRATRAEKQVSYPIQHIVIMVKENRTFDNYLAPFLGPMEPPPIQTRRARYIH